MRHLLVIGALLGCAGSLTAQEGPGDRRGRIDEQRPDTPVVNAGSAWLIGVTTYSRGDYQPSGVDLGFGVRTDGLPMNGVSFGVRLGSFVQNQAVLIGRTQGFFVAAAGGVRRHLLDLVALGNEDNLSYLKLEFVLEGAAAVNFNNPMPQGSFGGIVAPLLGLTFGGRGVFDTGFSIVFGPAYFVGDASEWHTQVGIRVITPRRRRPAP